MWPVAKVMGFNSGNPTEKLSAERRFNSCVKPGEKRGPQSHCFSTAWGSGKVLLLPNPLTNNPQPCHAVIAGWAKD